MIFPPPMPGIRDGKVGSSSLCWNSCSQHSSSAFQLIPCSISISYPPNSAECPNFFFRECWSRGTSLPESFLANNPENPDWRWQILAVFPQSQPPTLSKHWDVRAVSPCALVVPAATSLSSGSLLPLLGGLWHPGLQLGLLLVLDPPSPAHCSEDQPGILPKAPSCFPLQSPLAFHPHKLHPLVFIPGFSPALPSPQAFPGGWSHPRSLPASPALCLGLGLQQAPSWVIIGIDSLIHRRLINNLYLYKKPIVFIDSYHTGGFNWCSSPTPSPLAN